MKILNRTDFSNYKINSIKNSINPIKVVSHKILLVYKSYKKNSYFNFNNLKIFYYSSRTLNVLSCTDVTCGWKILHKLALEKYKAEPIINHPCFKVDRSDSESVAPLREISQVVFRDLVKFRLKNSAFNKFMLVLSSIFIKNVEYLSS